jgi:hypothetical protein
MAGVSGRCRFATNPLRGYRDECCGPGVLTTEAAILCWYAACIASGMLNMLTTPALTLVFLGVVVSLGTAFVWMLWEIEPKIARLQRNSDRFSSDHFG